MKRFQLLWVAALALTWSLSDGIRMSITAQNFSNILSINVGQRPTDSNHQYLQPVGKDFDYASLAESSDTKNATMSGNEAAHRNLSTDVKTDADALGAATAKNSSSSTLDNASTAVKHRTSKTGSSAHSTLQESILQEHTILRQHARRMTTFLKGVDNRKAKLGVIIGIGLAVFFCYMCCVVQPLASHLAEDNMYASRNQHLHDGRLVYEWSQTPKVVKIYIRPPEGVSKSELDISIDPRRLRVGLKGKPFFLDEETYDLVNNKKSYWQIQEDGELEIHLQKVRKAHWPQILHRTDTQNWSTPKSLKLKAHRLY